MQKSKIFTLISMLLITSTFCWEIGRDLINGYFISKENKETNPKCFDDYFDIQIQKIDKLIRDNDILNFLIQAYGIFSNYSKQCNFSDIWEDGYKAYNVVKTIDFVFPFPDYLNLEIPQIIIKEYLSTTHDSFSFGSTLYKVIETFIKNAPKNNTSKN